MLRDQPGSQWISTYRIALNPIHCVSLNPTALNLITRQLFNQRSMLWELLREFLPITQFHIGKIKSWRNGFADQPKSVFAFEQPRSFP
ncbi:hypothetical protein PS925_00841 [Pseudomonas fluorescens]|uniref:Uncharacterized protein n=1 Tax=Pseudomonas fluorescens TaxID=294 RepID=A0A5E7SG10_PSEFL|nr:hypothetical protein PS925_00841 [Pseudomonas fluorescens]